MILLEIRILIQLGKLQNDSNIMFVLAMVKAYKLEFKKTICSCIIVQEDKIDDRYHYYRMIFVAM